MYLVKKCVNCALPEIPDGLFQNLRWQQRGSDGEISWDPIYLTEQTAFIQGYVLHCTDGTTVINVTTGNRC